MEMTSKKDILKNLKSESYNKLDISAPQNEI